MLTACLLRGNSPSRRSVPCCVTGQRRHTSPGHKRPRYPVEWVTRATECLSVGSGFGHPYSPPWRTSSIVRNGRTVGHVPRCVKYRQPVGRIVVTISATSAGRKIYSASGVNNVGAPAARNKDAVGYVQIQEVRE